MELIVLVIWLLMGVGLVVYRIYTKRKQRKQQ